MPELGGERQAPGTPAETAVWHVQLLGGLSVERSGDSNVPLADEDTRFRHFRTHKAALLLARLLLYPHRSHSRDELADWLWPDSTTEQGRARLSKTLFHLRRQFAQEESGGRASSLFTADHQTIRVQAAAFQTDAADFVRQVRDARAHTGLEAAARWEAALNAYGGDLLPGFYDDWIENERQRFQQMWETAQEEQQAVKAQAPSLSSLPPSRTQPQKPAAMETTAAARTIGFPLTLTRFFGREADLALVGGLLTQTPPVRLVTLVGMGGIGKTRLALETARRLVVSPENTFGVVVFVPLADVREASRIAGVLAQLLEVNTTGTDDVVLPLIFKTLSQWAQTVTAAGRVLLILDNLEQFGETCVPLLTQLLASVPDLTLLVTSRQPVGITGEQEVVVGPLPEMSDKEAVRSPAFHIFVDRARLVRPDFAITPPNQQKILELCVLLEGVPLAIELAAAWTRTLSLGQIITRLHNRFDLLVRHGGAASGGGIPKRHQSLRAAIAWSFALLSPGLQTFFTQLSVFRGGWTVEAVQEVLGVEDATEPLLLLTERSLVLAEADEATGKVRYRMLESLREFAQEKLQTRSRNEQDALHVRQAEYFDALSHEADTLIETGRGMRPALALLGPERDNLRAVFARLGKYILDREAALEIDFAAWGQAAIRSAIQSVWLWPMSEAQEYLRLALAAVAFLEEKDARPLRARVLSIQGNYSNLAGDYTAALSQLRESLALWEMLGEPEQYFVVKNRLAAIAASTGDLASAIAGWLECLRFAQETGNQPREAAFLNNLANYGSDLEQRRAWIERAVTLDRLLAPGSDLLACSLNSMGSIAFEQNDWETARRCLEEAHTIAVADGAAGMMGVTKMSLAGLFAKVGEHLDRADTLLQEAQKLFEEKGELPRVAQVHQMRFHLGLQRGETEAAIDHARAYLQISHDAGLLEPAEHAAAQAEVKSHLQNAGIGHKVTSASARSRP